MKSCFCKSINKSVSQYLNTHKMFPHQWLINLRNLIPYILYSSRSLTPISVCFNKALTGSLYQVAVKPFRQAWGNNAIFNINESQYTALIVVSESIKKLFSIDYVNIYPNGKVWDYPTLFIPWFINFKYSRNKFLKFFIPLDI